MYDLHNRQVQSFGFQFFILDLNPASVVDSLNLIGTSSHIFVPNSFCSIIDASYII